MATLPEPGRGLLRDLDAAASDARAVAELQAEALYRAGRAVDAFALLTSGAGLPLEADRAVIPRNAYALLVETAVVTGNAQVAYGVAGRLAAGRPAWSAVRRMVQLWGLGHRPVSFGAPPG
jgi:hypothetical protein